MRPGGPASLLLDTNVLVLFVVGAVNRNRIESFKRTSQYTVADFDLLSRVLSQWPRQCTVPHVLAEVSNLTDLRKTELVQARRILKETISVLDEVQLPSYRAADDLFFNTLGLTDAAIASVAREHDCSVLTDDLDLYLHLQRDGITAYNFTHLRRANLERRKLRPHFLLRCPHIPETKHEQRGQQSSKHPVKRSRISFNIVQASELKILFSSRDAAVHNRPEQ